MLHKTRVPWYKDYINSIYSNRINLKVAQESYNVIEELALQKSRIHCLYLSWGKWWRKTLWMLLIIDRLYDVHGAMETSLPLKFPLWKLYTCYGSNVPRFVSILLLHNKSIIIWSSLIKVFLSGYDFNILCDNVGY